MSHCGSIINGMHQDVIINTEPTSALVELSNGQKCTSPCTITLNRREPVNFKIEKTGCKTETGSLITRVIESDQGFFPKSTWYSSIDYEKGAAFEFFPNPLYVKMYCENKKDNIKAITSEDK